MRTPIKSQVRKVVLAMAVAVTAGGANAAAEVWDGSLPTEGNPLTSQVYQDFTIYSLNYLSNLAASNTNSTDTYYGLLPSPTYNVDSSPGKLHDKIVIVTGNTGQVDSNLDTCGGTAASSGCDNAYPYPSSSYTLFNSMATSEPTVVVPGENVFGRTTWTATGDALRDFLNGDDMVFMFNLNESNGGDANTLAGQSLLVAMRVQLTDAAGKVLQSFYVGANNAIGLSLTAAQLWESLLPGGGAPNPVTAPGTVLDTGTANGWISTDPRWAYVHGAISVDKTTGKFLAMGDCAYTKRDNCETINQNLGADDVAFSAFSQKLSDIISDINFHGFMNVDVLTSGQFNGFEQLFIMAADIPTKVPEPGTLALAGLALAAFGVTRRRRLSTKA